jgi:hypothetical protein
VTEINVRQTSRIAPADHWFGYRWEAERLTLQHDGVWAGFRDSGLTFTLRGAERAVDRFFERFYPESPLKPSYVSVDEARGWCTSTTCMRTEPHLPCGK